MAKSVKLPAVYVDPIRLEAAKAAFLEYQEVQGKSVSTRYAMEKAFRRVCEAAGPRTYMHEVTPYHITKVMAEAPGQGLRNNTISYLRGAWKWAATHRHVSPFEHEWPINEWNRKGYEVEQPPYVPAKEFPALLNAADKFHPIYRAGAALGLYLLARGPSEIGELRLWDLDPHNWKISVTRGKTKMAADAISVCGELRLELIRWLQFYETWSQRVLKCGVQRDWFLLPRSKGSSYGFESYRLFPEERRAKNTISNAATSILEAYGSPARGSHAFRKFGGRALYDELKRSGHGRDSALDIVRSMYGHKSRAMTEHYLNLKMDREERNEAIVAQGGYMYGHNNPAEQHATPIEVKQLPASLVGGVLLGGASQADLDRADKVVRSLPVFAAEAA